MRSIHMFLPVGAIAVALAGRASARRPADSWTVNLSVHRSTGLWVNGPVVAFTHGIGGVGKTALSRR